MMMTIYHFLAVIAVVPTLTAKPNKCCTSVGSTCDVVFAGKTQYKLHIDFDKKIGLEVYGGNDGIDYILSDANAMIQYKRMTSGECKKYPILTPCKYFQCVPQEAVHMDVTAEGGVNLQGWIYNPDPQTSRLVVNKKGSCEPYRFEQIKDDEYFAIHFINFVPKVDPSVFEKDVSDCIDA